MRVRHGTATNGTWRSATARSAGCSAIASANAGSSTACSIDAVRPDGAMYVELHAASAFSFLDGATLPEALIARAAALGYPAIALLDRDGVYGAPRFHLAAKKAGLKAIIGAEITLSTSDNRYPITDNRASRNSYRISDIGYRASNTLFRLPVLVESQAGYRNLCRLLTTMKLRSGKGEGALTFD